MTACGSTVYGESGIEQANKLNKEAIKAMVPFEVKRLTQILDIQKTGLKSVDNDLTPHLAAPTLIIRPLYRQTPWAFCGSMNCVV